MPVAYSIDAYSYVFLFVAPTIHSSIVMVSKVIVIMLFLPGWNYFEIISLKAQNVVVVAVVSELNGSRTMLCDTDNTRRIA